MLLSTLFEHILVESGGFILGSNNIEIQKLTHFKTLADRTIKEYDKYRPYTVRENVTISASVHTFTSPNIPTWISSVVLFGAPQLSATTILSNSMANQQESDSVVWRYESPRLYCNYGGTFDIQSIYARNITAIGDPVTDYDIENIDFDDELFIEIMIGRFLKSLGRSRRAFTLSALPVEMDAAELVSEGTERENNALESLKGDNSSWHLALNSQY